MELLSTEIREPASLISLGRREEVPVWISEIRVILDIATEMLPRQLNICLKLRDAVWGCDIDLEVLAHR